MMELTDKLAIPTHVMARTMGDETVLLDLAIGTYFGLNPVGARIWQLLGEGKTLADVCTALLAVYEVERVQLEADVLRLTGELLERGLVAQAD